MNKFKNYLIVFLVLTSIVLAGVLVLKGKNTKVDTVQPQAKEAVDLEAKIISRKVDEKGLEHVVIEETNRIIGTSELSPEAKQEIDSLTKVIDIKDKQLKEYTSVNIELRTGLLQATETIDSLNNQVYTYVDKYIDANFIKTDSASFFDFTYNAELKHVKYWERDRIIGLPIGVKRNYIDIFSNDPRMTISGAKHLIIESKENPWSLRVGATALYLPNMNLFGYGPRLTVDYLGFGMDAQYLYFPEHREWHPAFSLQYNLLK